MTEPGARRDAANERAAALIAEALAELQRTGAAEAGDVRQEIAASRAVIESLATSIERHLAEERDQHVALGDQLGTLAGSLDRLVSHLQGLATLMAELLVRLAEPVAAMPPDASPSEALFQPGGEGVSLTIAGVPGFQALMEIQKALTALDQVSHASVERFQEGDSRILVALSAAIGAEELVAALIESTGQAMAVEESKPELARLRIRVVPVT